MDGYCVKEHFLDRLYGEYQEYKASVLSCPNAEIFSRSYETDVMVNLYEILIEKADRLPEHVLPVLLQRRNILKELYQLWLDKEDSNYSEMESHVESGLENIVNGTGGGAYERQCGNYKAAES